MSRRTAEANKAIRLAWEREQKLVQEGKGTRDWLEEQQRDILNPNKGKAYDEEGKAFEGQHMKSVEEYPEYQGNPDNIQFLSKAEHLEAHKGCWQNPTNWYYDPVKKEFKEFGDGDIVPCDEIFLSKPIVSIPSPKPEKKKYEDVSTIKQKEYVSNTVDIPKTNRANRKIIKGVKSAGKFIVDHPLESLEIAGTVAIGVVKIVSSLAKRGNHKQKSILGVPSSKTDMANKVNDIVDKASRVIPGENDVSGHKQRYHTKTGVIWKDKGPYHRGSK